MGPKDFKLILRYLSKFGADKPWLWGTHIVKMTYDRNFSSGMDSKMSNLIG